MKLAVAHICLLLSCLFWTPACGHGYQETCVQELMANTSCARHDFTCLCYHGLVSDSMTVCFESHCFPSVRDYLNAQNITTNDCGREDREPPPFLKTTSLTLGMAALACVALRLLERSDQSHKLRQRFDDWVMALNGVLLLGFTVVGIDLPQNGMGRDSYTLPFSTLEFLMKLVIAHEVLYVAIVMLTKLSILFVYYRIFPLRIMPRLRVGIHVTMCIIIACGIGQVVSLIFQCTPVAYFWTRLNDQRGGWCINITAWGYANGAVNVALDTVLICMPLPELIKLRLYWKKKLRVCLLMVMGGLVILISIPRLVFMKDFIRSTNPTWRIQLISFVSALEAYIGVICACLPRIYILFSYLYRKYGGSSTPDVAAEDDRSADTHTTYPPVATMPYIHHRAHTIDPERCPHNIEQIAAANASFSPWRSSDETATDLAAGNETGSEVSHPGGRAAMNNVVSARSSIGAGFSEDSNRMEEIFPWTSKTPCVKRRVSI